MWCCLAILESEWPVLVVSERLTNSIDTFMVQEDGTLSPLASAVAGAARFGHHKHVVVTHCDVASSSSVQSDTSLLVLSFSMAVAASETIAQARMKTVIGVAE